MRGFLAGGRRAENGAEVCGFMTAFGLWEGAGLWRDNAL